MGYTVLILGGDSVIGKALSDYFISRNIKHITTTRQISKVSRDCVFLDLERPDLWEVPPYVNAAVICAGISNLNFCRNNHKIAEKINVENILLLARKLNKRNVHITYISSNLVFDGTTPSKCPADKVNPKTVYGSLKAKAEIRLSDICKKLAIIRITKVFHKNMTLLKHWNSCLTCNKAINAFSDYNCAPLDLRTTIIGVYYITTNHLSGIWHFSPIKDVKYSEIAFELACIKNYNRELIKQVSSRDIGRLEHSPCHTTLDSTRSRSELNLNFMNMKAVLRSIYSSN